MLVKHAQGTPLTEAERQQRRDAARARWAAVIGAGLGAATGKVVADKTIGRRLNARIAAHRSSISGIRRSQITPAVLRQLHNTARHAAIATAMTRTLRGKNATPQIIRSLRSNLRRQRAAGLAEAAAMAANPQFDPATGQFENPDAAIAELHEALQPRADEIVDLQTKARPSIRTVVAGSTASVRSHTRRGAARTVLVAPDDPRYPVGRQARGSISREERRALLAELRQQHAAATDPAQRDDLAAQIEYYGRPKKLRQRGRSAEVPAHDRVTPQHTSRVPGYPGAKTKAELRERIEADITARTTRFSDAEAARRVAAVAATHDVIRSLQRRIKLLHGTRSGITAAAIGLTAAGFALIAHHVAETRGKRRRLALAKATDEHPESSLGKGMAETFRQWIDRLLGRNAEPMNLGDTVAAALAPGLTQAFADGARQPPAGGSPYILQVDFDSLNPSVRRHMATYALDRIVQISAEQREAIRQILMDNTVLQGIGPLDTARLLRETIGLTAHQAAVVQAYRVELQNLDPAALERKLRDARYDRTVRRAIETNTPLTAEQIEAMVAAYHRRMLALRAETIARTESIRAVTAGAVARAQDVLDQHPDLKATKIWVATKDPRTRDSHRELDGKAVEGIETPFRTINEADVRWPCDIDAPADEVINCRCSLAFRYAPKSARLEASGV